MRILVLLALLIVRRETPYVTEATVPNRGRVIATFDLQGNRPVICVGLTDPVQCKFAMPDVTPKGLR